MVLLAHRGLAAVAGAVALAGVLAGCANSSTAAAGSTTLPSGTSETATPTDASNSVTSASPSSTLLASAAATTSGTCTGLTFTATKLGSAGQQSFVTLTVTNPGASCLLTGGYSVQLHSGGAAAGSGAVEPNVTGGIQLASGASATAKLTDDTTCSAPLSDTITLSLDGVSAQLSAPLAIRACVLSTAPLSS